MVDNYNLRNNGNGLTRGKFLRSLVGYTVGFAIGGVFGQGCNFSNENMHDEEYAGIEHKHEHAKPVYVSRDPTVDEKFKSVKSFRSLTMPQRVLEQKFVERHLARIRNKELVDSEKAEGDGLLFLSYNGTFKDENKVLVPRERVMRAYHLGLTNANRNVFGKDFEAFPSSDQYLSAAEEEISAVSFVLNTTDATPVKMFGAERNREVKKVVKTPGMDLVLVVGTDLTLHGLYDVSVLERVVKDPKTEIVDGDDLTSKNVFNDTEKLVTVIKELGLTDVVGKLGARDAYAVELAAQPNDLETAVIYFNGTGVASHFKKMCIEGVRAQELDSISLEEVKPETKRGYWVDFRFDRTKGKVEASLRGDTTGW